MRRVMIVSAMAMVGLSVVLLATACGGGPSAEDCQTRAGELVERMVRGGVTDYDLENTEAGRGLKGELENLDRDCAQYFQEG